MSKFTSVATRSIVFVACAFSLISAASAATVGYWRFEDSPQSFLQDSSGNGHNITAGTLSEATHQLAIAGSGNSSAFYNPIPLTGATNSYTVRNTTGIYASIPDNNAFTSNTFTIEGFVNHTQTGGAFNLFASHWGAGNNTRSWAFGTSTTSSTLTLLLSDSTNGVTFSSLLGPNASWNLAANKDYYVAASFDSSKLGAGQGGVTLYLKNLTDNGALQTVSLDHNIANLMNANSPVILVSNSTAAQNPWIGFMDEVRFSNSVLGISELLITAPPVVLPAPEPSTLLLAACGLLMFKRRRRAG